MTISAHQLLRGTPPAYEYVRRVHYYETDAMGVVHHSNYLRLFEEARVSWYHQAGLRPLMSESGEEYVLAVVDAEASYKRPARFNDPVVTRMQVRLEGSRFHFRYAILKESERSDGGILAARELLVTGATMHVPVNRDMKVVRPPRSLVEFLKEVPWTETWP